LYVKHDNNSFADSFSGFTRQMAAQLHLSGPQLHLSGQRETMNMKHEHIAAPRFFVAAFLVVMPAAIIAADLKSETISHWEEYVSAVDAKNGLHLTPRAEFLSSDLIPGQIAKLRDGEIAVSPAEAHIPVKIPAGLIHDWVGAAFIPNATVKDVFGVVRDYDRYAEFYQPNVMKSKAVVVTDEKDQISLVMMNKSAVGKTALDCDYRTTYVRLDEHRWYSVSDSTRIQEISEYGTRSQHILPENHGTGLIWRLHTVTRFEERDGGVYIELEAVALSRDIPSGVRWMVEPVVRRVSRSALSTSLRSTASAMLSHSGQSQIGSSDQAACSLLVSCKPNRLDSARTPILSVR